MSTQREHGRARIRPTSRWVLPGAALLLVVVLLAYVALVNWQVRVGDVQWRYTGSGSIRVVGAGDRFLVAQDGPRSVVLDRSDGTKVLELEDGERGFAVGDAVMATGEGGYRFLSASGEELWSAPSGSGTSVAPVAADVDAGRAVLLEQHDSGPDVLRGIDLASGDEAWRVEIDQYGGDPFDDRELQRVERVRVLPVRLPSQDALTVLSLEGEPLHTDVAVSSSPFVANNGQALVVDEQRCSDISILTATEQREVVWGDDAPDECHVVSVGDEYAFLITGPWDSTEPARLLAVDLASGEPTGLDVTGLHAALRNAVDMGSISRGPGAAVVVRDDDEYRLYDVRTGEQTWSGRRAGRWSYDAGPAGAVLVTEPSGLVRALSPAGDDSVRHELLDPTGGRAGVVYELDIDMLYSTNLVLDQGQAAVAFGRDLVVLERG